LEIRLEAHDLLAGVVRLIAKGVHLIDQDRIGLLRGAMDVGIQRTLRGTGFVNRVLNRIDLSLLIGTQKINRPNLWKGMAEIDEIVFEPGSSVEIPSFSFSKINRASFSLSKPAT
jgi:hypothetical protein